MSTTLALAIPTPATAATQSSTDLRTASRIAREVTGSPVSQLQTTRTFKGLRLAPATAAGRPVDTLVQPQPDGVAVIAVLSQGQSAVDFTNPLPAGQRLVEGADGGLLIQAGREIVGTVAPPWAVDARGRDLPTRYVLRPNGGLTQVVDTRGATYPIAADPKYSLGFYRVPVWYVEYYWSDMWRVKNLMDRYGGPTQAVVSALCGSIPSKPGKAACSYLVVKRYATLAAQVNYGIKNKRCMKVRNSFGAADLFVFRAWTKPCIK